MDPISFSPLAFFKTIWPHVSQFSLKAIKKKPFFHELCLEAGVEIFEDQFDFAYFHALAVFLLDQEHHDWAIIFEQPDVRKAFHTDYSKNEFSETLRALDHHLHVTIKTGPLKQLNNLPSGLFDAFEKTYREEVQHNAAPSTMQIIRQVSDTEATLLTEYRQSTEELKGLINTIKSDWSQPTATIYSNVGYQEIIDKEHQAQLDVIKKLIDQKSILSAQRELIILKDRIFDNASDNNKARLLNNIGYTYIMQDKRDEAIDYYQQALRWNSSEEAPLTNLIGIYFAKGRHEEAAPIIEKVKEKHPGLAAALNIYRAVADNHLVEPDAFVPDGMEENAELLVSLVNLYVKKDLRKSLQYATILYRSAPDNDNYADIYCNIALLALVGEHIDFETRELQSEPDKAILKEVGYILKGLWARTVQTEYKTIRLPLLDRLILSLTVIGDFEGAAASSRELLAIEPDNFEGKKFLGLNLLYLNRYEEAAAIFDSIDIEDDRLKDYISSWIVAKGKSGDIRRAAELVENYLDRPGLAETEALTMLSILPFLYADTKQFDLALIEVEKAEKRFPKNVGIIADKARILNGLNRHEELVACNERLIRMCREREDWPIKDLFVAANYFSVIGDFKIAAELMARFINPESNSDLTCMLADFYFKSGQKSKALMIYANLRNQFGVDSRYSLREVAIYNLYGDYAQAIKILEEYISKYPEDKRSWIRLGLMYQKANADKQLKNFLKVDASGFQLDSMELDIYTKILHRQGQHQRGVELLYDYRRKHPGPEANALYVNYNFYDPLNRQKNDSFTTVKKGAAVFLKNETGEFYYIIEDLPENEVDRAANEISTSSPVYKILKGKKVGDKVNLVKTGVPQVWTIKDIIPKYRLAHQQSIQQNTTIYANETDGQHAYVVTMEQMQQLIEEQIATPEELEKLIQESEQQYLNFSLPLFVFARYGHKNPIDFFQYFLRKGSGIRFAVGDVKQYNAALNLAKGKNIFVLDISVLLTLNKINTTDHIPDNCRLIIAPQTRELIEDYIEQLAQDSCIDRRTYFEHQGQKYYMLTKAEERQAELQEMRDLLKWMNTRTETLPCKSLLDHEDADSLQFIDLFGPDILQSVLLAKELDGIYVSDDAANRGFIKQKFGISSIWTQTLLKSWTLSGELSSSGYIRNITQMARLNYQHTTVDRMDIIGALILSNFKITGPFETLCEILSGKYSDDRSVHIALSVCSGILTLGLSKRDKEMLIYHVLLTFILNRCLTWSLSDLKRFAPNWVRNREELEVLQESIDQLTEDVALVRT